MTPRRPPAASLLLALLLGATLALGGCSSGSAKCDSPNTVCSPTVCTNLDSDPQHCGTCGNACAAGQSCSKEPNESVASCKCPTGSLKCDGVCVSVSSDPKNCGTCDRSCGSELCQDGACVCPAGGCTCPAGQSVVGGVCLATVYAACFNTGELVALDDELRPQAVKATIGAGPQSMAYGHGKLLVADTIDNALYRVLPQALPVARAGGADRLDKVVNHLVVKGTKAYAVCSGDNLVQVLDLTRAAPASGVSASRSVDEIPTSLADPPAPENTSPSFAAFAGDKLYVTLLGNCMAPETTSGNRLLELDVSAVPGKVTRELVFDPASFEKDAGVAENSPRPAGLAAVGTKLYVAIGNLTPGCLGTAGPGYLAVVDTAADPMTSTALGLPESCRNPSFVLATADRVYVTCLGAYGYAATVQEALVVLDPATDAVLKTTTFARCADPFEVGPAACKTAVPGRLALHGDRLLIADNNAGRMLVTDLDGNLVSGLEAGVDLCPLKCPDGDTTQSCYQFVGDVAAIR